jgi:tellurite resistance protein TerC
MYFLLAGIVHRFVYLRYGLAVILTFVGLKMVAIDFVHVPIVASLAVIVLTLAASIFASLYYPPKPEAAIDVSEGKTGSIFGSVQPGEGTQED